MPYIKIICFVRGCIMWLLDIVKIFCKDNIGRNNGKDYCPKKENTSATFSPLIFPIFTSPHNFPFDIPIDKRTPAWYTSIDN